MAHQPGNTDHEIDLAEVSRKFKGSLSRVGLSVIKFVYFIRRNIIVLIILLIIGVIAGFYLDKKAKVYDHTIIVIPNFGSVDYLYSKIGLLEAKLREGDTLFLKNININHPRKFIDIEIEPINNVYEFAGQRTTNFELLKLMAEDGDVTKVIDDPVTSKNYGFHKIKLSTKNKSDYKLLIEPVLEFLNTSEYFSRISKQQNVNLDVKLKANDSIIKQIDGILNSFSARGGANTSGSLVYNENTELSDIIKNKDELIEENAVLNIAKINNEKIIKETSVSLNMRNTEGVNGKAKYFVPMLLLILFLLASGFVGFVKRQSVLRNKEL